MRIDIRARRLDLTGALRDHIQRRLRFALGRFSAAVARVDVALSDENGPRGGRDTRCRLLVVPARGSAPVVIEELGEDPFGTVSLASERAGRSFGRLLSRLAKRRTTPPGRA